MQSFLHSFWFTQIFGLIALIFVILAWNAKTRKKILHLQVWSLILLMAQYALLHAYTAVIVEIVTLARNLVFAKRGEKKWANSPLWTYVFMALAIAVLALVWQGWASLLPVVGVVVGTWGMSREKPKSMRFYILLTALVWIPYNIIVHSYTGLLTNIVSYTALLVGMYRLDRKTSTL